MKGNPLRTSMRFMTVLCILFACNDKIETAKVFFEPGELVADHGIDSLTIRHSSALLSQLHEPTLKVLPRNTSKSIRLIVEPPFWASHVIRIDKRDSVYAVVVKLGPDESPIISSGLTTFSLCYESSHVRMDSIVNLLFDRISRFDFSRPKKENKMYADGYSYLLEVNEIGDYRVKYIRGGDLESNRELTEIIHLIQTLVPNHIIPEPNPHNKESYLFSVLKRDSV